jgi:glycosyltransferase involved in cell wall biosynthesis
MRIALTCNFSPWSSYAGGGQRSTHALATALAQEGHDVSVIYTRPPFERFSVPAVDYQICWATFFDWRSRRAAPLRPLNAFSVAERARQLHEETPLDVVHGNGEEVVVLARWASARGITVVTTPRYPTYPSPMLKAGGPTRLTRVRLSLTDPKYLLLGRAVRFSTWCCPTSRYSAEQVQVALGAEPERVRVIPNGVSQAFFDVGWEPAAEPRPLLFYGRLAADKGVDLVLKALAQGPTTRRLTVIGRGDDESELRQLATELGVSGRVTWRSWTGERELARALGACSMAVLPSRHESFGNVMAEALAVGVPLISTRAGSIPELVEHGKTGWLVPPNDPNALAAAIATFEREPGLAARFGKLGQKRMLAGHSWQAVARRYAELYRSEPGEG